jgi:hypothetical protein
MKVWEFYRITVRLLCTQRKLAPLSHIYSYTTTKIYRFHHLIQTHRHINDNTQKTNPRPEVYFPVRVYILIAFYSFNIKSVVGVLDESYSAKTAQPSNHTGPPGYTVRPTRLYSSVPKPETGTPKLFGLAPEE